MTFQSLKDTKHMTLILLCQGNETSWLTLYVLDGYEIFFFFSLEVRETQYLYVMFYFGAGHIFRPPDIYFSIMNTM